MLAVVKELDGGKVVISDVTLQEQFIYPSSLSFVGKLRSRLKAVLAERFSRSKKGKQDV
jgi:hypothetical protein